VAHYVCSGYPCCSPWRKWPSFGASHLIGFLCDVTYLIVLELNLKRPMRERVTLSVGNTGCARPHVTPVRSCVGQGGLPSRSYQFARHLARRRRDGAGFLLTDRTSGKRLKCGGRWLHTIIATESKCVLRARRAPIGVASSFCALAERCAWADVVHLHAAYSFPTIPTLLAAWVGVGYVWRWSAETPVIWTLTEAFSRLERLAPGGAQVAVGEGLYRRLQIARIGPPLTSEMRLAETRASFRTPID